MGLLGRLAGFAAGVAIFSALPAFDHTNPSRLRRPASTSRRPALDIRHWHAFPAGARVPFVEFNAAAGPGVRTNGYTLGPNDNFGSLAAEATGRQAVLLIGRGQYLSFTLTSPASGMTVHYALPDAPHGGGITEPLSLYVNQQFVARLSLTSKFSWLYGPYSFSKIPQLGMPGFNPPHDFYNDVRYLFSSALPAGTVVKLQVDAGDNSPWYAINTADFELVPPPIAQPVNAINAVQPPYAADNTGVKDSTRALQNAIDAGEISGRTVYLPPGTYALHAPLQVNQVTILGAGEWYTTLTGLSVEFAGHIAPASSHVNISHLALFGKVAVRRNQDGSVNGFNGGFSDSTISHIWIQNEKVGAWIVGPVVNLTLKNLRVMDLKADGVNFDAAYGGVSRSRVENSFFRNTQDDGIALWSQNAADAHDTIAQNTVDSPGLANNIAVYGSGNDVRIARNLLQDTVTRGGGINIGARFNSVPMSGTLYITQNVLNRDGQFDPGFFHGIGAIWFWPQQGDINADIQLSHNRIQASPYQAIQFLGPNSTANVHIRDNAISRVGTYVFTEAGFGAATVRNTSASGVGIAGIYRSGCLSQFDLIDAGGNSGWNSSTCASSAATAFWIFPDIVTFQNAAVGETTPPIRVAIVNRHAAWVALGAIAATPGFTLSPDSNYACGRALAPANNQDPAASSWCLLDVSFTPAQPGITTGSLNIPESGGKISSVLLVGSAGGNISPSPAALAWKDRPSLPTGIPEPAIVKIKNRR